MTAVGQMGEGRRRRRTKSDRNVVEEVRVKGQTLIIRILDETTTEAGRIIIIIDHPPMEVMEEEDLQTVTPAILQLPVELLLQFHSL